jgi:hypothetical protein
VTRPIRLALIACAWLLPWGAAESQAQHFPLETTHRLTLHNVTATPATLAGRKGLQLTVRDGVPFVWLEPGTVAHFPNLTVTPR